MRTSRRERIAIFLFCALAALATLPALAGPSIFSSTKGTHEITLEPDATGFEVPVLNASKSEIRVRVRLVVPAKLAEAIETSSAATLEPRSITGVSFDVTADALPEEAFDGIALVRPVIGGGIERRRIRIVVGAPAPTTTPRPIAAASDKLTIVSYRTNPWDDTADSGCDTSTADGCLLLAAPVWDAKELEKIPAGQALGVLSGESDRVLLVEREDDPVTVLDDTTPVTGLDLSLSGDADAGTYEGSVDLLPDDDKNTTVSVTLIVTDHWYWAALALLAGVVVAILVRRFLGLGRKVSQLKVAAAEADLAFDCGKDASEGGDSFEGYSIAAERIRKRGELRAQLDDLASLNAIELSEDDPAYKAALANVEAMEAHAAAWCAFKDDVAALQRALAEAPRSKAAKPVGIDADGALVPEGHEQPRWRVGAEQLAEPPRTVVLDFEGLDETRARVKKATALARSWGPLTEQLWSLDSRIRLIEARCAGRLGEAEAKALVRAKMSVSEVRWELWTAQDADDLERRTSQLDLAEAERNVARLSDCLKLVELDGTTLHLKAFDGGALPGGLGRKTLAWLAGMPEVALLPPADDPAVMVRWEKAKRRFANAMVLWTLVAALVYAGLKEIYLDAAVFGTVPDYLQALAWGLGATVTVDYLSSQLDKLRASRAS